MEGSRAPQTGSADSEAAHLRAIGARSGARPTLRRLPLIAFLAIAVLCLKYLDGRIASDYKRSAADLAVQSDALIERELEHHADAVHALRVLVADAPSPSDQQARLALLGRAITGSNPAVVAVYRLDARGDVVDVYPRSARDDDLARENHLLVAETAEAIAREQRSFLVKLIEHANDSILAFSPDGKLIWFNEQLIAHSGYTRQELEGGDYRLFVAGDQKKLATERFSRATGACQLNSSSVSMVTRSVTVMAARTGCRKRRGPFPCGA